MRRCADRIIRRVPKCLYETRLVSAGERRPAGRRENWADEGGDIALPPSGGEIHVRLPWGQS